MTREPFHLARTICREAAGECNQPKMAAAIASAKTEADEARAAQAGEICRVTIGVARGERLDWRGSAVRAPSGP